MESEFVSDALLLSELESLAARGVLGVGNGVLDGSWDDQVLQDLLQDPSLPSDPAALPASSLPAVAGLPGGGQAPKRCRRSRQAVKARMAAPHDQTPPAVCLTNAAKQRVYRERLKQRGGKLTAECEAAAREIAALRAENAALEERVASLRLVDEYTEEMMRVAASAAAAAAEEQQQELQAPPVAPAGGGRLSAIAGAVFRLLPPSTCQMLVSTKPSSTAQLSFFVEHASISQFRALHQMRRSWLSQLAQQCIEGDEWAERCLGDMFEAQKTICTAVQHRLDILSDMAQNLLPRAAGPHAPGAAFTGSAAGVNPVLLPLRSQVALTPCQRAQLSPHWRSFLSESRVLRQEMRATLARISAAPEALIATYQAAQTSAEAALASCDAAAELRTNYHAQLRMFGRLNLALFTLLSTKQMALLLVPHREHATDPEQICKMLLGGDGDEEASPSGVDFGHVLVDSGAV